ELALPGDGAPDLCARKLYENGARTLGRTHCFPRCESRRRKLFEELFGGHRQRRERSESSPRRSGRRFARNGAAARGILPSRSLGHTLERHFGQQGEATAVSFPLPVTAGRYDSARDARGSPP